MLGFFFDICMLQSHKQACRNRSNIVISRILEIDVEMWQDVERLTGSYVERFDTKAQLDRSELKDITTSSRYVSRQIN